MTSASGSADSDQADGNTLYAALARTATRSIALYFSRPVRLFRPAKVSGWHSIKGQAAHDGVTSLTPQYLTNLVKSKGFMVIPKHFVPPILLNAGLGIVLWTSYSTSSGILEPYLGLHPTITAAASGAFAGATQALVAAPAENIRLVFEGGSGRGWSHAWKEVFRGTESLPNATKKQEINEFRQVRTWMREVGEMAGRGWDGWRWGVAKDFFGFAVFFAVFDITRRVALNVKTLTNGVASKPDQRGRRISQQVPGIAHGVTLVSGGVLAGLSYEFVSRPFDVARKSINMDRLQSPHKRLLMRPIFNRLKADGMFFFFKDQSSTAVEALTVTNNVRRYLYNAGRTLARVGPWGVGFLVWEIFGGSVDR